MVETERKHKKKAGQHCSLHLDYLYRLGAAISDHSCAMGEVKQLSLFPMHLLPCAICRGIKIMLMDSEALNFGSWSRRAWYLGSLGCSLCCLKMLLTGAVKCLHCLWEARVVWR